MRENHFEDGKWWVSPYNFVPEVRESLDLPEKVEIHDATLRDGEQTPGVVFSVDDKIEIARMLDLVGVERIEAGLPAVSPQDEQAIKEITKLGLKSDRLSQACHAVRLDVGRCAQTQRAGDQLREGKWLARRLLSLRHDAGAGRGSGKPLQGHHGGVSAGLNWHR